jgi:hypothetical protein
MLVDERRPFLTWAVIMSFGVVLVGLFVWMLRTKPGTEAPPPKGTVDVPIEGRAHVFGRVDYEQYPPAGGNHSEKWLNCGIYADAPAAENVVHSLEHGAVWVTYDPQLAAPLVEVLRGVSQAMYRGKDRYVILSPLPRLPAPVVATAWGHQLKLGDPSDVRLAQFLDRYVAGDQAPEQGSPCTGAGGTGTPLDRVNR